MNIVKRFSFLFLILLLSSTASASLHLAPSMTKSPTDLTYLVGTTGNELVWAFDADENADDPSKYIVTIDDVAVTGHNLASWQDNVDIVVNVDGLALGNYIVKIVANDTGTDNNQAPSTTDTTSVNVVTELASTTDDPTSSSTSDANAFPITLLSLILALAIGIPILKHKDFKN